MSTNTATETAIEAAQRLDELIPAMNRARRMRDLWDEDYDRDRHISMALLHDLGRDKPGDKWATKAGTIAVTVRAGNMDWEAAYKAILATYDTMGALYRSQVPAALEEALEAPVPRKAASEPFLVITASRDLPPAIEQARREGALEALAHIGTRFERAPGLLELTMALDELADAYGGFGEEG